MMHLPAATFFRSWLLALAAWAIAPCLHAGDSAYLYTLNLPCQANLATPEWLGHPVTPAGTFASLDLPIIPPESGAALLVTISFQEKDGGFLRISWKGPQGEQVLSNNFYEGTAMESQRSLLIPASVVQGSGALCLQVGDVALGVSRISLEWLEEHPALVSPDRPGEEAVPALGKATLVSGLDGQAPPAATATMDGSIVSVPITSGPQRIEQGVEFSLQLEGAPRAARVSFEESGLPWGRHFVLWINQERAGTITPEVPDLLDSGFTSAVNQPYVGWREGSIYLPASLLRNGLNTMQLSVESDAPAPGDAPDDDTTSAQPLALNHLVCQFDYSDSAALAPAPGASAGVVAVPVPPGPAALVPSPTEDSISTPGASALPAQTLTTSPNLRTDSSNQP